MTSHTPQATPSAKGVACETIGRTKSKLSVRSLALRRDRELARLNLWPAGNFKVASVSTESFTFTGY